MRISRIKITNFANFSDLNVETGDSIVIVGENKVGKSNFIRALQLILDPGRSERDSTSSWRRSRASPINASRSSACRRRSPLYNFLPGSGNSRTAFRLAAAPAGVGELGFRPASGLRSSSS